MVEEGYAFMERRRKEPFSDDPSCFYALVIHLARKTNLLFLHVSKMFFLSFAFSFSSIVPVFLQFRVPKPKSLTVMISYVYPPPPFSCNLVCALYTREFLRRFSLFLSSLAPTPTPDSPRLPSLFSLPTLLMALLHSTAPLSTSLMFPGDFCQERERRWREGGDGTFRAKRRKREKGRKVG